MSAHRCFSTPDFVYRNGKTQSEVAEHSKCVRRTFDELVDECFLRLFELKANIQEKHFCFECSGLVLQSMHDLRVAQDEQEKLLIELAASLGYELIPKF